MRTGRGAAAAVTGAGPPAILPTRGLFSNWDAGADDISPFKNNGKSQRARRRPGFIGRNGFDVFSDGWR